MLLMFSTGCMLVCCPYSCAAVCVARCTQTWCTLSSSERIASSFDCKVMPAEDAHRLCFCTSPVRKDPRVLLPPQPTVLAQAKTSTLLASHAPPPHPPLVMERHAWLLPLKERLRQLREARDVGELTESEYVRLRTNKIDQI
jgi:hypothetical protein